ncbi:MAG: hypothetical protein ACI9NQ_002074 [Paracoccaceae bacterium]|jgi:hypothetical protein
MKATDRAFQTIGPWAYQTGGLQLGDTDPCSPSITSQNTITKKTSLPSLKDHNLNRKKNRLPLRQS